MSRNWCKLRLVLCQLHVYLSLIMLTLLYTILSDALLSSPPKGCVFDLLLAETLFLLQAETKKNIANLRYCSLFSALT